MKPIKVIIVGHIRKSSHEICSQFLDINRWSEFKGYSILPGIKDACFESRTAQVVGSRIRVRNTDGSSHIEEIIEWDVERRIALKFQEFSLPLRDLATHFIEAWEFHHVADGTEVSRRMTLYPKGLFGWLVLVPISRLMKKAFLRNLAQTADE